MLHFYTNYLKESIKFEGQVALRLRTDKNTWENDHIGLGAFFSFK